jgi:hypothetical protein
MIATTIRINQQLAAPSSAPITQYEWQRSKVESGPTVPDLTASLHSTIRQSAGAEC